MVALEVDDEGDTGAASGDEGDTGAASGVESGETVPPEVERPTPQLGGQEGLDETMPPPPVPQKQRHDVPMPPESLPSQLSEEQRQTVKARIDALQSLISKIKNYTCMFASHLGYLLIIFTYPANGITSYKFRCADEHLWHSPACRSNAEKCVLFVTGGACAC